MTGVRIKDGHIYDMATNVYLGYLVRRAALTVVEDVTGRERSFGVEEEAVKWLRRRRAETQRKSEG